MEVKPGYKTTEFWISLVGPIVALLTLFGIVNPEEADTLAEAVVQAIVALFALGAAALPLVTYIKARAEVKSSVALSQAPVVTEYRVEA